MGGNTVSTGFGKYVRNYGSEEGKLVKVTKKGGIWWGHYAGSSFNNLKSTYILIKFTCESVKHFNFSL